MMNWLQKSPVELTDLNGIIIENRTEYEKSVNEYYYSCLYMVEEGIREISKNHKDMKYDEIKLINNFSVYFVFLMQCQRKDINEAKESLNELEILTNFLKELNHNVKCEYGQFGNGMIPNHNIMKSWLEALWAFMIKYL